MIILWNFQHSIPLKPDHWDYMFLFFFTERFQGSTLKIWNWRYTLYTFERDSGTWQSRRNCPLVVWKNTRRPNRCFPDVAFSIEYASTDSFTVATRRLGVEFYASPSQSALPRVFVRCSLQIVWISLPPSLSLSLPEKRRGCDESCEFWNIRSTLKGTLGRKIWHDDGRNEA